MYKDGLCLSPKRSALVSPDPNYPCKASMQEYSKCVYFDRDIASSLEKLLSIGVRKASIVASIHVFNKPIKSQCERFVVIPDPIGYLAFCGVLNRYLTIYEAETCERHYLSCPLRKLYYRAH